MECEPRIDLCLAMLVRSEAAILKRCLISIRPFVSGWVIFDTGLADGSEDIAKDVLRDIPGDYRWEPFTHFAELRTRLFREASSRAGKVLMVDADEVITVQDPAVFSTDAPVVRVETGPEEFSFYPPRLFSSSAEIEYTGMVFERLKQAPADAEMLNGVRLHHLRDGYRHRERPNVDYLLLDAEDLPEDASGRLQRYLDLAQDAMDRQVPEKALEHFQQAASENGEQFDRWYALYMQGLLLERVRSERTHAIHTLHQAHELCPDRLEALHHLVRMTAAAGDIERAYQLSEVAVAPFDYNRREYFEPPLHSYETLVQHIDLGLKLGKFDEASRLLRELRQRGDLRQAVNVRLKNLNKKLQKKPATARGGEAAETPMLTIGMATYDDFDGVYFTINSIVLYHPEILEQIEFLIIDNNPDGICAESLQKLAAGVQRCRYVPYSEAGGTSQPRNQVFTEARGRYVLCLDSHVQLVKGAMAALLDYFRQHPDSRDLIQGPLLAQHGQTLQTQMRPEWRRGFHGRWLDPVNLGELGAEPFEIEMQGLGLFACRRDAWLGFNPRFRGFGGEEGYIQDKYRAAGAKTLCLPALAWLHRFSRPTGTKYALKWADRIRNYMIGACELRQSTQPIEDHFMAFLKHWEVIGIVSGVKSEMDSPLYTFDAVYFLQAKGEQPEDNIQEILDDLGVGIRTLHRWFDPVDDPELNRALAHREIVASAQKQGFESVLILRDPKALGSGYLIELRESLSKLETAHWKVALINKPSSPAGVVAVAYHRQMYGRLLDGFPDEAGWSPGSTIEYFLNRNYPADITNVPALEFVLAESRVDKTA